ncbi:fasciculation and elongation protein zeta-1 [Nematostella vectensis]|uniref:fasciculation and elongation protein zeta-1 n=1 Tax=Nematostella vectensis TaxID=45351 RepID=UPI00138FED85|nr:fasciculation and elongation protein zeta-1 [Nematostella vectensis]
MAAGESPLENGRQHGEDDSDWSDFASDCSATIPALSPIQQAEKKPFPRRDSEAFTTVCKTTRTCFPDDFLSSRSWFVGEEESGSKCDRRGNKMFLDESLSTLRRPSQFLFLQSTWRGSATERLLLKSLNIKTPKEEKQSKADTSPSAPVQRFTDHFDFHLMTNRNIEFLSSSKPRKWNSINSNTGPIAPENQHTLGDFVKSRETPTTSSTLESQPNMNTEVWSDSDNNDTDEIFLLFGQQLTEKPTSFDETQAAAGLHHLSYEELLDLRDEMAAYVKEYSDVLVDELMVKDEQLREQEIKNLFISSLLALQSRLREVQSSQGRKKTGPAALKYLTTVIPYDEQAGGLQTGDLEKIVEIMDAMAEDSPMVPSLLTDYILTVLCP